LEGILHLTPMENKEIVREGYNTIASKYLEAREEAVREKRSEDLLLLQDLVQRLPKGAKVLDAGCGSGVPVTRFLSQSLEVIGVDFSDAQINLARKLVPEAQFVCQDMTKLVFSDNSFDAICSYYAIIHVPRQQHKALLQNFYRILKPSGLVLLCMGSGNLAADIEVYLGTQMYWSHYDSDTNIKMLEECGFKIVWHKFIDDPLEPSSKHLFVMAKKH